jgi:dolichol-phosphate mannosyltransferase
MKIAVVVPTYNEKENVPRLVAQIEEVFAKHSISGYIVIVDDNSPDGTGVIADSLARVHGNIHVIHRTSKLGIGSAYREGFKHAMALKCTAVIEMDADLSHNPSLIPSFISQIEEGYSVVVGSRYVKGGNIVGWSWVRRLISRGANLLARSVLQLSPFDVTSGYRAYHPSVLSRLDLSTIKSDGYAFQVEMIYRAQKEHFKIREIPITFVDRKFGKSKLGRKEILGYVKFIFLSKLRAMKL